MVQDFDIREAQKIRKFGLFLIDLIVPGVPFSLMLFEFEALVRVRSRALKFITSQQCHDAHGKHIS